MDTQEISHDLRPDLFLKGEVCTQYIRCNKQGCRCQTGEPHGPYFYRVWREGARVNKVYIRPMDLQNVRAACNAYQDMHKQLRALRQRRDTLTRGIRTEWRRTQRMLPRP